MNLPIRLTRVLAPAVFGLASFTALAAGSAPVPFTAKYQVLQGGQAIGEATVTLKAGGDGQWIYQNRSQGTGGLAAMLGASSEETTRFQWVNGSPQTVSYDSQTQALKAKQRHLTVAPGSYQVTVDDGKGPRQYAGSAGMVDRNTLPYALGLALRGGQKQVTLPVAVKQRVEQQQFQAGVSEAVSVPAGRFQAEKVTRSDDPSFNAWYVPSKYPMPVKLAQHDGGDLTLELVSYQQP